MEIPRLSWTPLDLALEPASPFELPLPGSMLRGVFGHALRQVGCALERANCEGCELSPRCGVYGLFETPLGVGDHVHPWRLQAWMNRGRLEARVTLFGRGRWELPLAVRALEAVESWGLGSKRVACRIVGLSSDGVSVREGRRLVLPPSRPLPAGPGREGAWTLRFRTPTRLKASGRTVRASDVDVGTLLRAAARRLSLLTNQWGDAPWEPAASMLDAWASSTRVVGRYLEDVASRRYSNRAGRAMPVEGFVGELRLEEVPAPAAALLSWAGVVGLGHGTTWGQGDVEVERQTSPGLK